MMMRESDSARQLIFVRTSAKLFLFLVLIMLRSGSLGISIEIE